MFACIMIRAARDAPQTYATPKVLLDALTPYGQDDVQGQWSDDRMLMVQALTWNTPQSRHESAPEVCSETGRVIVSWVRLDNRSELCTTLGLADSDTLTDPQIILASHREWGTDCADQLEGDFSFVIYDPAREQAFCARDSIGAKPFFYYTDAQVFIAGSTAAIFPMLKNLSITPSRAWMAHYMADAPHDMTASAFEGVSRLAPGNMLPVAVQGAIEPQQYFRFEDTAPIADHRDPKYVDAYRTAFHRATEARLRSAYPIGAESSGGLDSSSIIAHAVKHLPHEIDDFHCFGLCHLEQEPEYILQTAMHCDVRHSHILTHSQLYEDTDAVTRETRVMGHPAEHPQMLSHSTALRQCQQLGIRTLLCGFGGDEMVTNRANTLNSELFSNRQFGALVREMPGNTITRRLRFLINLRRLSRPTLQAWSSTIDAYLDMFAETSLLQKNVLEDFDMQKTFRGRYLQQKQTSTVNAHILHGPELDPWRVGRLEASALIAQSYGIEYRMPLFDRQLMLQFLRTPAIEKRHRTMGRYLHRRAVAGSIPDMITWKRTKDMGRVIGGLADRSLPDPLTATNTPPDLASLLDFTKLHNARDGFAKARTESTIAHKPVKQMKALWRATLLARWLG